jgi:predicted signal transduction protein with EAL and GGDEF domain
MLGICYSFWGVAPPLLSAYLPIALCALCVRRGFYWARKSNARVSDKEALQTLRRLILLAGILAMLFVAGGFRPTPLMATPTRMDRSHSPWR